MKAIAITPSVAGVKLVERDEPRVEAEDDIKIKVLRVGICGTDREEDAGGRAQAPSGQQDLVIGHEMFGLVEETGGAVTRVQKGDYAVFTVRRGCGNCLPCLMNRPDMCRTGKYTERGIWGQDGYQTEHVVDKEQYIVRVPRDLESVGVLLEPLSVSEKAIDEAVRVQSARLPDFQSTPLWLFGKRCLVAGLGPIGLLAAMTLRLRGAIVYGLDVVDSSTTRPQWLTAIGGQYVNGKTITPAQLGNTTGGMDLILEATGVPLVELNLLDALGDNGVYVLTGIPGGDRPLQIDGAEIIRRLVLKNQVMLGSVNAARDHFQMAVEDLQSAMRSWQSLVQALITHRYTPGQSTQAFESHEADEIKTVIEWSETS
ncbi:MAG TPA: glucose 1-dehydrogenase [bacterium]|jgi:threonine dehydrogenase-like Zn-dependent dehydrogenase